jgi:PIN domain nuclease of toxin-antitoxin system
VTTVLLDTHILHWWADEPEQLSAAATSALSSADELAVAAISWVELAWLGSRRLILPIPLRSWLEQLAREVRTASLTPAIAARAAELPTSFPRDPSDRLIYATAVEHGWRLVTKDQRIRTFDTAGTITIW